MPFDRIIDVRIGHLRRRLSKRVADGNQLLKTVRGVGYMLASEVTYKGPVV